MARKYKQWFLNRLNNLSSLVIIATMISIVWINLNNKFWLKHHGVIRHDVVSYYSYLPAIFVYHDLSFSFFDEDPDYFYDKMYQHEAPNGGYYQKVTMGLAFMYLPFYLIGHATAMLLGAETSGYSPPYFFFILFSSAFFLLIAMLLLRRILLSYSKDWIVALVLLAIVPGTHMLYYATREAAMPHVYNFFLFVLFIWFTVKWHHQNRIWHALALGLIFGLISLIRPTNALVAIIFMLYDVKKTEEFFQRPALFFKYWKHVLVIAFFAFLVWVPQLIHWKCNTGMWLFYSYDEESFFFNNPQIINGLFSYRKGWLLYTPVMLLALAGIGCLYKQKRDFFLSVMVFALLNVYIVFSWWSWWYGGGFGMRPMIDSYPLMAISLAGFISYVEHRNKTFRFLTVALITGLALHGFFQNVQYRYGAIHHDSMTRAAYWHAFGNARPAPIFYDLIEPPDYDSALHGIQSIKLHSKTQVLDSTLCNYEHLTPDGRFFYSNDQRFLIGNTQLRSDIRSRSGNYSVQLPPSAPYGSNLKIRVLYDDVYNLSVWKNPYDSDGHIVVSAPEISAFYRTSQQVVETDANGWGKIELIDTIPSYLYGLINVYLWNPGQDTIYFDDLKILKVNEK